MSRCSTRNIACCSPKCPSVRPRLYSGRLLNDYSIFLQTENTNALCIPLRGVPPVYFHVIPLLRAHPVPSVSQSVSISVSQSINPSVSPSIRQSSANQRRLPVRMRLPTSMTSSCAETPGPPPAAASSSSSAAVRRIVTGRAVSPAPYDLGTGTESGQTRYVPRRCRRAGGGGVFTPRDIPGRW